MPTPREAVRGATVAGATAYLGGLVLAPWIPPAAIAVAALVALAALAFGWNRDGRPRSPVLTAALGLPLHLMIVATGGAASPLLPLFAPWVLVVGAVSGIPVAALLGAGATLLVIGGEAWAHDLGILEPLEMMIVVASGLVPASVLDRTRRRASVHEGALTRILEEAGSGRVGDERVEASRRIDDLGQALDRVRRTLGARRAVLWDVHAAADRARPRLTSGGATPPSIVLTGDPLRWAWEEALPLRLETPPHWATGSSRACVVPLEPMGERAAILTLEYEAESGFPTAQMLDETTAQLRVFLTMQQQEARAVATRERFGLIADMLRRLPREVEPDSFARELASSTVRLAGATGAVVALWEQEVGRVLAVVGDDGGPHADAVFGPLESELALAARNGATVVRERRRGESAQFPVAAPGERWYAEPRALVVVPLQETTSGTVGVLAVWSADVAQFDQGTVEILETLAPYAALQLRQTRIYGTLREYAERDALTGLHNRRVFEQRILAEKAHYQRYRRPLSLLLLDVDHFKRINDTLGHEAGDAVLRALGELIRGSVREVDLAARLGGEEFVILLPETSLDGARDIAERLRVHVADSSIPWRGKNIPVRISVGVSACPDCVPEPQDLVKSADAALYSSKAGGRNRVTVATFGSVDRGPDLA